ncbi:MAG: hypothetical protein JSS07_04040 [Proteobacteria bacterium]|nr:hypothetical protein [Pseudomonadota bacterium]
MVVYLRRAKRFEYIHSSNFVERNVQVKPTTKIGILNTQDSSIGEYLPSHVRAADAFLPDKSHEYYKTYIATTSLPFIAGPSGHAGILLRTATMVGHLSASQMQKYILAIIGMIVGGGMHSIHEVMMMSKQLGFSYQAGNYNVILDAMDASFANAANNLNYDSLEKNNVKAAFA